MNYQQDIALTHSPSFRLGSVFPFPPSLGGATAISNIQSMWMSLTTSSTGAIKKP
jgi:hypothetical protein